MKYYELAYLTSSELSGEKLNALQERVISCLQEKSGTLNKAGNPIKKTLGYPIKKNKDSFLIALDFSAPAGQINDLKKRLDEEPEILRCIISGKKTPAETTIPPISEKFKKERTEIKKPAVRIQSKEKKVELKEIEEKLDEILGE